jgi:lysine decarboxylase/arginine decarboxylase
VLRELHGFIHMYEDTPEFMARHIIREARSYLEGIQPPFFKALLDYAEDGSYSWHCPGHSGGVAFLKEPGGQMFHQFFGENMLRADVCNAVDELGQLLDHTGPVAASERNAARIFNADHCFFVTNGTSTSNKMVWHHEVAPGDVVVVDRNCHKSILHSIIMTGAIPVFLRPTRNHFGIIGPDPAERVHARVDQGQDQANPLLQGRRPRDRQAAHPDADPVHLRRRPVQHRDHQEHAGRLRRGAALRRGLAAARRLPPLLRRLPRHGQEAPRPQKSLVYSTQSIHKLLAGISQASHVLVQDAKENKLDRHLFNEAFLMHTSTSPQYAIIASCDVAAAMMEPPGGTALVEESITEALDFRRAMRKVDQEYGKDWWFKVWGPDKAGGEGIGRADDWIIKGEARPAKWHGFGNLAEGFNMLDPIKSTVVTPGLGPERQVRQDRHPGVDRHQVPGGARGDRGEDRPLQLLHPVHHRHHQGPLEHAAVGAAAVQGRLRQEPADVAHPAGVLPAVPALRAHGAGRPVPVRARAVRQVRHRQAVDRHLPGDLPPGRKPSDGPLDIAHRRPSGCEIDQLEGRNHHQPDDALPRRHPAADPGRRCSTTKDRRLPEVRRGNFNAECPGFETTSTASWRRGRGGRSATYADCVKD